jgi:hypothetical protein
VRWDEPENLYGGHNKIGGEQGLRARQFCLARDLSKGKTQSLRGAPWGPKGRSALVPSKDQINGV